MIGSLKIKSRKELFKPKKVELSDLQKRMEYAGEDAQDKRTLAEIRKIETEDRIKENEKLKEKLKKKKKDTKESNSNNVEIEDEQIDNELEDDIIIEDTETEEDNHFNINYEAISFRENELVEEKYIEKIIEEKQEEKEEKQEYDNSNRELKYTEKIEKEEHIKIKLEKEIDEQQLSESDKNINIVEDEQVESEEESIESEEKHIMEVESTIEDSEEEQTINEEIIIEESEEESIDSEEESIDSEELTDYEEEIIIDEEKQNDSEEGIIIEDEEPTKSEEITKLEDDIQDSEENNINEDVQQKLEELESVESESEHLIDINKSTDYKEENHITSEEQHIIEETPIIIKEETHAEFEETHDVVKEETSDFEEIIDFGEQTTDKEGTIIIEEPIIFKDGYKEDIIIDEPIIDNYIEENNNEYYNDSNQQMDIILENYSNENVTGFISEDEKEINEQNIYTENSICQEPTYEDASSNEINDEDSIIEEEDMSEDKYALKFRQDQAVGEGEDRFKINTELTDYSDRFTGNLAKYSVDGGYKNKFVESNDQEFDYNKHIADFTQHVDSDRLSEIDQANSDMMLYGTVNTGYADTSVEVSFDLDDGCNDFSDTGDTYNNDEYMSFDDNFDFGGDDY